MILFDEQQLNIWKKRRRANAVLFTAVCFLLACAAAASIVFFPTWGRALSQTVCTICLSVLACYVLFFVRQNLYFGRIIDICKVAASSPKESVVGSAKVEKDITTYRFLPFHAVEVHTESGDRRLFLQRGEIKAGITYEFSVCQNIICEFRELS